MVANELNDIVRQRLGNASSARPAATDDYYKYRQETRVHANGHEEKRSGRVGRYRRFIPSKARRLALMWPVLILSFIVFFICTAFIDVVWTIHFKWGLSPQLTKGNICARLVHNDRAYTHPLNLDELSRAEVRKLSARSFAQKYIKGRKALVMRGALDNATLSHNQQLFSDENLRRVYSSESIARNKTITITVETDKFESRADDFRVQWPMQEYIKRYRSEDVYAVLSQDQILPELSSQIQFLPFYNDLFLQGELPPRFTFWWSSGGTNSSIHVDATNNLEMVVYGKKTFYVADNSFLESLYYKEYPAGFHEERSPVSFEKPNLQKYPLFSNIKWKRIDVGPGDGTIFMMWTVLVQQDSFFFFFFFFDQDLHFDCIVPTHTDHDYLCALISDISFLVLQIL